ncbi:transporter [Geodermatophilus sp. Leaf369]|uniref:sulfite exporter TauE/SafE family protein n=1 Tax=Geodermatophilus sp. Leaf369 TaxID=1736354 RepID=UPI000700C2A5|nr:sulfite exporter TauE/SafE family protein [Geodermatophilus sp. Leaf369]KQS59541.1 transporter [Geodermatophilus sp. Leaf369]
MSWWEWALLLLAGVGGGLTGSIAGLASLVSYPALLASGLPPVTANVTNTVALVFNGVGSISASRPELVGQARRLVPLSGAALLGGVTGTVLLLLTPAGGFERIVPFLIAGASVAILVQRPPRELAAEGARHSTRSQWGLALGVYAIAIYGGYFGAAAGVLMLAMFLLTTGTTVPRGNAAKNVLLFVANLVAAVGFALFADVAWAAVLPLAIGFFVGGRLGPRVVRRVDGTWLRRVIAVLGLGLALKLGFDAFG